MNITSPKIKLHPKTFRGFEKTSDQYKKLKKYMNEYFNCEKSDYYNKYISIEVYVYIEKSRTCKSRCLYNSCLKPIINALTEEKIIQEANINSVKVTRVRIDTAEGEGVIVKLIKCPNMVYAEVASSKNAGYQKNYIPFR